jgi:hypothetical protein
LDSVIHRSRLFDSVCNRTTELNDCEFGGMNGAMSGKMNGGIFRNGGIGNHAEISKETVVIEYRTLTPGYMVAGDKVIIPTKKIGNI